MVRAFQRGAVRPLHRGSVPRDDLRRPDQPDVSSLAGGYAAVDSRFDRVRAATAPTPAGICGPDGRGIFGGSGRGAGLVHHTTRCTVSIEPRGMALGVAVDVRPGSGAVLPS